MALFEYNDSEALGTVRAVDTARVAVMVDNVELLRKLQVNRLVVLQSSRPGQHLVGIVQKITRDAAITTALGDVDDDAIDEPEERNTVRITLIGTFIDRIGSEENVFRRTLETVPEIDARCFPIEGDHLTKFMRATSYLGGLAGQRLSLGTYTLDENAEAYLNANRFFQRHAVVVGSTGSGKSWTTARLLEQVAELPHANAILFDIHGEYRTLSGDGIRHFRIAGPNDLGTSNSFNDGVVYLPYWLLSYEEMTTMLIDRSDQNAPNQAMVLSRTVTDAKRRYLEEGHHRDVLTNFTIDSPVPYDMEFVLDELRRLDTEMVQGSSGREKQGEFHGRLSRFIARLENKLNDRRLGFMLGAPEETNQFDWLPRLGKLLLAGTRDQETGRGGVKIVDFSEVPSDVLPLILGRFASLVFQVQQWTPRENRHPIAIFCDEAHLYIPNRYEAGTVSDAALYSFERIAKEGRKYGVGLVVISQRPSEVSRTVLSQCNNFIALRLTNAEDQNVVQCLLPDSLGGFTGLLPILDTGEALVVGDASLLPSRIRISQPNAKPDSGTVDFWDEWSRNEPVEAIQNAVHSWRRQSLGPEAPDNS
jgi:DNA helicase HerA-like ATPase